MAEVNAVEIRRNHNRMIRDLSKQARDLRGRVLRKYQEAVIAGKTDDEAKGWVLECFDTEGLTERRLHNILERGVEFGNPKAMAYTEARVAVWLEKMERDVNERRTEIDRKLDEFDGKTDEDWVNLESTDSTGGKFAGTSTKKRPIWAVKLDLLEDKVKTLQRYFDAVKALRGSQPLLNVVNNVIHTDETAADLTERIKQLEQLQRIQNGVSVETPEA